MDLVCSCGAKYVRIFFTAYANTRRLCSLRSSVWARIAGPRVCVVTERGSERVRVDGCVCHGGKHLVFSSVYRVLCSTVTFYAERCQLNYCFVANWLCGYLPVVGCLWLFPRFRGLWESVRELILRLHDFVWFKVQISSLALIRPGSVQRGWARWDDCDGVFPDEFPQTPFCDRFGSSAWRVA